MIYSRLLSAPVACSPVSLPAPGLLEGRQWKVDLKLLQCHQLLLSISSKGELALVDKNEIYS